MEDRIGGQQTTMEDRVAENGEDEFAELGADQKVALGKWFLLNSPPGQVQQVAKGKSLNLFGGPTGNCSKNHMFVCGYIRLPNRASFGHHNPSVIL